MLSRNFKNTVFSEKNCEKPSMGEHGHFERKGALVTKISTTIFYRK